MKGGRAPDSWERCTVCRRNLAGHIKDIQAGLIKAHTFKVKKGKK